MKRYRVAPGSQVDLNQLDPNDTSAFDGGKEAARHALAAFVQKLEELQNVLYAERKHKLLVVLQALDTAGKDSIIHHVFGGVNPAGVRVTSFKVPSEHELAHDYLWRVHQQVPATGEIGIFNRSHYEDVLVVRVHKLVSQQVWERRYEQIKHFEQMLVAEGMTIVKFYLHIDREEQKRRLQERLDDPKKIWKFQPGDLKERALWPDYIKAYEDALTKTSTEQAPWYIIPSNHEWYRNLIAARIIVETLEALDMHYPAPQVDRNLKID